MPYSYVIHTAAPGQELYDVPFPFLHPSHVIVLKAGVQVPLVWSGNKVRVSPAPPAGTKVTVQRSTPRAALVSPATANPRITAASLAANTDQALFVAQEILDGMEPMVNKVNLLTGRQPQQIEQLPGLPPDWSWYTPPGGEPLPPGKTPQGVLDDLGNRFDSGDQRIGDIGRWVVDWRTENHQPWDPDMDGGQDPGDVPYNPLDDIPGGPPRQDPGGYGGLMWLGGGYDTEGFAHPLDFSKTPDALEEDIQRSDQYYTGAPRSNFATPFVQVYGPMLFNSLAGAAGRPYRLSISSVQGYVRVPPQWYGQALRLRATASGSLRFRVFRSFANGGSEGWQYQRGGAGTLEVLAPSTGLNGQGQFVGSPYKLLVMADVYGGDQLTVQICREGVWDWQPAGAVVWPLVNGSYVPTL